MTAYSLTCPACNVTFETRGAYMNHGRGKKATCTQEMRFWARVDKDGPNGCWLYTGFRKWDGYGWLSRYGRFMTAHRYAWILTHGDPQQGMSIMHICDNPPCCNPAHLKLGTHAENMADCKAKGRVNGFNRSKPLLHPNRVRPVRREA